MPNRDVYNSKPAAIRDFSGGWNVADNEYNTNSRFQPISDNVFVGVDSAIGPRFGYKLYADLKQGDETEHSGTVTYQTFNNTPYLRINWASNPFAVGDTVIIRDGYPLITIADVPAQPTGTYVVCARTNNYIEILLRGNSTASATSASSFLEVTKTTHVIGGNIIECAYFQGYVLLFTDIGEIASISPDGVITRIWDPVKSIALSGSPAGWRKQANEEPLTHVSYTTHKQTLLAVNGRLNDKPLEIDLTRATVTQFLVDPSSGSNANVYSAEFIHSSSEYVLLVASNNTSTPSANTPTTIDISAKGTSGVFVGNATPDDAVQINLGTVTKTIDPRITGVATIRGKVFIAFYDSGVIGTLGAYNSTGDHEPDFKDQIPQHGALNHRTIQNIGNDLLMCDFAGVPAFSQSQIAATIVPQRISQLIDPALNKHLSRLSQPTLQNRVFAVYNIREQSYMLFVPKFDEASVLNAEAVPYYFTSDLAPLQRVIVHARNHNLSVGDYVDISGSSSAGGLAAADIDGRRPVVGIVDTDYFVMELDAVPTSPNTSGGGGSVVITPVNDEMIGYVFTLNTQLKIRRWTRFRNLPFTAGTLSRDGRVFFHADGRLYQFGTSDLPYYADKVGDYTRASYSAGLVTAGERIQYNSNLIYTCLVTHTTVPGSFDAELNANADYWEEYLGMPITWAAETPWSDLADRFAVKRNNRVKIDATGSAEFTFSVFVDSIYRDADTFELTPSTTLSFVGKDAGGFGAGSQNFGGGRRTKEEFGYSFPFRCRLAKIRMEGSSMKPLRVSGIFFLYQKGSIYR